MQFLGCVNLRISALSSFDSYRMLPTLTSLPTAVFFFLFLSTSYVEIYVQKW